MRVSLGYLFKFFYVHLEWASFYTSFGLILTLPVPSYCFLVALSIASASSLIWLSSRASTICHHTLSILSISYFPSFVGMTKGLLWLQYNWQLSESKLINKKMIMLQSTLHYSFKVLCEHYLINHHNSSGEDKHCWLSYLDHILKEPFFFLVIV